MDAGSFRHESNIQQQIRRYKLRNQQTSSHHLREFPADSQQLPLYPAGTCCNNLSSGYSEDCPLMITSVPNYGVLPGSSLDLSTRASDHQGFGGNWKSLGAQQGSDWMVSYAGYNDHVQLESRKMEFVHHPIDQNHFDHVVAPAVARANGCDDLIQSGSNEPTYPSNLHVGYANYLVSRQAEDDQELRIMSTDASTHGLSLSLSSNTSKMDVMQFGEQLFGPEYLRLAEGNETKGSDQDSKLIMSIRPSIIRRTSGKSFQDLVSPSSSVHQSTGPLGPFTGYATILNSSSFLKPAQELLDEICSGTSSISARLSEASSDAMSGSFSHTAFAGVSNAVVSEAEVKGNSNSSMSSSTFHSSNDGSSRESLWPEYQQKKAKLLCLQEEVCRRYKQYHQQMQIIDSSFELVSGLDDATPFLSLTLKAVSRSFRCLKHTISDQINQVTQALGEEILSPNARVTSSRVVAGLRYMDETFQKQNPCRANAGFIEPQQHAWRPQRGLPERAVSILRAWLFEHFLHPYPTDADKQMLAIQTGLSRNQVSNWFINARVRVWKPMVEEIHMLETKGATESNQSKQPNGDPSSNKLATVSSMLSKQVDCSGTGFSVADEDQFCAEQWDHEKRPTSAFHPSTNMVESSMSFLPCHRSGLDIGSLGTVSLTLGLQHGVDNIQHRQQQVQHHEDQLMRLQFGGRMIHDFTV